MWRRRTQRVHDWLDPDRPLTTDRLAIVELTRELDGSYLALLDDEFMEIHHWPPYVVQQTQRQLGGTRGLRHLATKGVGVLTQAEDPEQAIGFLSIELNPAAPYQRFHVGLQIAREHRQKGYTTEALRALVAYFAEGLPHDIVIATSRANGAMVHICRKLDLPEWYEEYTHPDGSKELAAIFQAVPESRES